jgi:hypothetical protein
MLIHKCSACYISIFQTIRGAREVSHNDRLQTIPGVNPAVMYVTITQDRV